MRTLKYAILGLLKRKPRTGYDIAKEFKAELGNFWRARHSQIYPELKRLLEEGLIEYEIEIAGETMEKKVYNLKPAGEKDLVDWLNTDEEMVPTAKDKFRLRMYFASNIKRERLIELLNSQLKQRQDKLAMLEAKMDEQDRDPEFGSKEFGDFLVLESAILREQAYVEWLERSIRRCYIAK
jgi:DNA-binding PadR family transcriptional regulator